MYYKIVLYNWNISKIDAIISSMDVGPAWEKASTAEATYMYQIRAAMNMNIYQPYSDEQKALNQCLTDRQAGLRLCDYAWRLFVQSVD